MGEYTFCFHGPYLTFITICSPWTSVSSFLEGSSNIQKDLSSGADIPMIGHSRFLLSLPRSRKASVISKHDDKEPYIWESASGGTFAITPDNFNSLIGPSAEIHLNF